jgi:hypothetical protein
MIQAAFFLPLLWINSNYSYVIPHTKTGVCVMFL